MSNAIARMMQNRPGGGSSTLPPEQLTVERCIDIHDTDTATHVFEWRNGFATYLLRNVEVMISGKINADYGLIDDRGIFTGWASELPDCSAYGDKRGGTFLPEFGRLRTYRDWQERQRERRAFEKLVKFPERYGMSGTALRERLSPLFPSTKEAS